tara:strand:- start:3353 stop:3946 length:594 start_codon:yes stop_codon:yes gene_type:complete
MMPALKISLLVALALVGVSLLTLRVTGLDPRYIDPSSAAFAESGRTAWPGLWLTGEVIREPVTNWDWVLEVNDPIRGSSIMLETRSWYGIPHSVTINLVPRGDKLYVSGSEQGSRLEKEFPHSKAWWANIERDPRVRMKIDGKIYEMTVALVADQAEVFQIIGRDPITRTIDAEGNEQITGVRHYWRVYQRNIPEYE